MLKDVVGADVALVETVAHTEAGAALLRRRRRDLRRRRPGHQGHHPEERPRQGLQAQHAVLGRQRLLPAGAPRRASAFRSRSTPTSPSAPRALPQFGYGCAVFMQSDIVDFQRQGWKPEEIMAGLCNVLPKNIWLYVSQIPNLSAIGTHVPAAGRHAVQPGRRQGAGRLHRVALQGQGRPGRRHRPPALRRGRRHRRALRSGAPVGERHADHLHRPRQRAPHISYTTTRNEATRCYFCKNKCLRTFIDVKTSDRRIRITSRR